MVDLETPQITAFELRSDVYDMVAWVSGDEEAEWDFGAGRIRLRPTDLIG